MATKQPGVFRLASISDIHTGHNSTLTEHILANLRRTFPDSEETGRLDMIVFGGDFFDRLLNMPDDNVAIIEVWIHSFLQMAKKRDIVILVLEGTRTHDWRQNRVWTKMNDLGHIGAELLYVDTLSIVHLDKFNIDVLCVPDDWHPETDETWKEVQQLLQSHGLEKVDYSVVHGSFAHQLPEFVDAPKHLGDRYLEITRHYVLAGHVHLSSVYRERLLANGSFDRLTHGEEDPKGHWRLAVGKPGGDELVFVENTGAKIYKSFDCEGLTIEEALNTLEAVERLPEGSAVRILARKRDPILGALDVVRKTWPLYQWTTKTTAMEETQKNLLVDMRATHREIAITADNLQELLLPRLRALISTERLLTRCCQLLAERV